MLSSRRYWPAFQKVRHHQELMERMMQTSGVDAYTAARIDGGLALFEACTKCRYCLHEEACRLWLALDELRPPPDFCPNAGFFRSCRNLVR
jgi:hypothetical protein